MTLAFVTATTNIQTYMGTSILLCIYTYIGIQKCINIRYIHSFYIHIYFKKKATEFCAIVFAIVYVRPVESSVFTASFSSAFVMATK